MNKPTKPKILLVDDEPQILEGIVRNLRTAFDVHTATSGAAGLATLEREPNIAVVMSDMRMPVMNGSVFLARARELAPDAIRLLLTGQADIEDAIAAINDGQIFRFLKKPCPPDQVRSALGAAVEQHRLVTAERELLEQTLRGSVKALCDTLALANPAVFGTATRVKHLAHALGEKVGVELWQVEVAAMLCQLGAVTLPPGLYERRMHRERATPSELAMLDRVSEVTDALLAPIPRLDDVRAIVRAARGPVPDAAPRGAHVLRAALEFEALESSGVAPLAAVQRMRAAKSHDPAVLDALTALSTKAAPPAKELPLGLLREGMVIAVDVFLKNGTMLVARGHEVTPGLLRRLENFRPSLVQERIAVATDIDGAPLLRAA